MATSHYCDGKWRTGTVAECERHKRLDKKQMSVYRDDAPASPGSSDSAKD